MSRWVGEWVSGWLGGPVGGCYLEEESREGGAIGAGQLQAVMPGGVLGLWVDSDHTISITFHQVQVLLQAGHLCTPNKLTT